MLFDTYFFVPANKRRFLKKSLALEGIGHRVLDFEDSVSESSVDIAVSHVTKGPVFGTDWIRVPISSHFKEIASRLVRSGFKKFVIPKVKDVSHFDAVINQLITIDPEVKVIILVENALIYLHLEQIIKKWKKYIIGIGLGSHDFTATTGIRHHPDELLPVRLQLSLLARAYDLIAVDIASMNISDKAEFEAEIQSGYNLGYRAKFILHPFQLEILNGYPFFSREEVTDAAHVLRLFSEQAAGGEVVVTYKGTIYERAHMDNLKEMVAWGGRYYGTDR